MRLWLLGTLNYARLSTWSRSCNAWHVLSIAVQELYIAHADILWQMILPRIESTSQPCLIRSPSRTSTSESTGHTVTGMEKHLDAKITVRRITLKRNVAKRSMTASTTDTSATGPSERRWLRWDALKRSSKRWISLQMKTTFTKPLAQRLTYTVATGWIHTKVAHFDSVPTRYQPDFKKALSTMHRLKQAEDEKQYAKWSQSSFSSSWQWQTNWWESDYEYSPQRWYNHWLHGVTRYLVANYSFAEWVSARIEFKNFFVNKSVTADGSLPSPTGSVNTIHLAPEIHEHFMIQRLRNIVYIFMHNLNNLETTVTNCMSGTTHTDAFNAQYWARCAPSQDVLIWCVHTSHWLKGLVRVISPHPIHACARGCLSVLFLLSFYFFLKSFFHLFLIPAMVPDENSMEDPLCNSAIGSMVSLDYVTPDTRRRRTQRIS